MKKSKIGLILSLVSLISVGHAIPTIAQTVDTPETLKSDTETIELNNYARHIVKVNNEKMSYIQLGNVYSNKSIVIIHGSAYSASAMIPYGKTYAKEGYNVVLVDLPGHYGDISKSRDKFSELGDSVAALINKLVKQNKLNNKSEIQGWSLGGSVALDIASRHPKHIKSVGLIDSSSNWYGVNLGSVTEETRITALSTLVQQLKSQSVTQDVTNTLIADIPNVIAPVEACNSDFSIDKVLNIDEQISQIKVPVYDFFASDDILTTLDKQKDMLSQIKDGHLYVAEDYNHCAVLENPQLVHDSFVLMRNLP
ncbi:alpha/beta hydrolase [Clostridium sp. SHJSY1]|uniref:alpha/beta fold hydrolase n=1 Tax=Clostridium sp. SHJSY1 TaxID=2942483 RepID=UPI002873FB9F|nr:alpha/beta hydrolase [Clostridium sp. SHJSY1]MDS0524441.1 alpha/beta hydrolase [Clostridium sp. SHJSY1]